MSALRWSQQKYNLTSHAKSYFPFSDGEQYLLTPHADHHTRAGYHHSRPRAAQLPTDIIWLQNPLAPTDVSAQVLWCWASISRGSWQGAAQSTLQAEPAGLCSADSAGGGVEGWKMGRDTWRLLCRCIWVTSQTPLAHEERKATTCLRSAPDRSVKASFSPGLFTKSLHTQWNSHNNHYRALSQEPTCWEHRQGTRMRVTGHFLLNSNSTL